MQYLGLAMLFHGVFGSEGMSLLFAMIPCQLPLLSFGIFIQFLLFLTMRV